MKAGATEIMNSPRINPVVTIPVCTPVLPVANGTAAGLAGLAPPAFASSERTAHRLASGGIIAARLAARNNVRQMMRALAPQRSTNNQKFRPDEILLGVSERRFFASARHAKCAEVSARRPGAPVSEPRLAPGTNTRKTGLIDSLASGTGCYSHTPPV